MRRRQFYYTPELRRVSWCSALGWPQVARWTSLVWHTLSQSPHCEVVVSCLRTSNPKPESSFWGVTPEASCPCMIQVGDRDIAEAFWSMRAYYRRNSLSVTPEGAEYTLGVASPTCIKLSCTFPVAEADSRIGLALGAFYLPSQTRFDGRLLHHHQCDLRRSPVSATYRTILR